MGKQLENDFMRMLEGIAASRQADEELNELRQQEEHERRRDAIDQFCALFDDAPATTAGDDEGTQA